MERAVPFIKHWCMSVSKGNEVGVGLARWLSLQILPHRHIKVKVTCRS